LLDGFTLGAPISEHHGVKCCPAIKENTTKKYIVKIITVPASQAQFDALLLAGAYKDPGDAMEYFRGNGEDLLKEDFESGRGRNGRRGNRRDRRGGRDNRRDKRRSKENNAPREEVMDVQAEVEAVISEMDTDSVG
jgi:hypothetical protein